MNSCYFGNKELSVFTDKVIRAENGRRSASRTKEHEEERASDASREQGVGEISLGNIYYTVRQNEQKIRENFLDGSSVSRTTNNGFAALTDLGTEDEHSPSWRYENNEGRYKEDLDRGERLRNYTLNFDQYFNCFTQETSNETQLGPKPTTKISTPTRHSVSCRKALRRMRSEILPFPSGSYQGESPENLHRWRSQPRLRSDRSRDSVFNISRPITGFNNYESSSFSSAVNHNSKTVGERQVTATFIGTETNLNGHLGAHTHAHSKETMSHNMMKLHEDTLEGSYRTKGQLFCRGYNVSTDDLSEQGHSFAAVSYPTESWIKRRENDWNLQTRKLLGSLTTSRNVSNSPSIDLEAKSTTLATAPQSSPDTVSAHGRMEEKKKSAGRDVIVKLREVCKAKLDYKQSKGSSVERNLGCARVTTTKCHRRGPQRGTGGTNNKYTTKRVGKPTSRAVRHGVSCLTANVLVKLGKKEPDACMLSSSREETAACNGLIRNKSIDSVPEEGRTLCRPFLYVNNTIEAGHIDLTQEFDQTAVLPRSFNNPTKSITVDQHPGVWNLGSARLNGYNF